MIEKGVFITALVVHTLPLRAQGQPTTRSRTAEQIALDDIQSYVLIVCPRVSTTSSAEKVKIEADASAKLKALASKLLELGFGARGSVEKAQSVGVDQRHLRAALADVMECRSKLTALLTDRYLPSSRSTSTPSSKMVAPSSRKAPSQSSVASPVGCWRWSNGKLVSIQADGQVTASEIRATWKSLGGRQFSIQWPAPEDNVSVAPDGRTASGTNSWLGAFSATRISATDDSTSFVGTWRWGETTVVAQPDNSIVNGAVRGRWLSMGAGQYRVVWAGYAPIDQLVLSSNGREISGANQFQQTAATRMSC